MNTLMTLKTEKQIDAGLARSRLFGEWLAVLEIAAWAFGAMAGISLLFRWAASCGR